ncbi:hypothetical protein LA080_006427 [Diaporthe eres]|nr:hypothetical protein LA080_006427 [Diaporthe eres]
MVKQRYLVVIVRPASEVTYVSPGRRASLLVPFSPEAIISTFIDELWRRLARHDGAIPLTAETHNVSLHLEHENGPVIDVEDLLSDVITDTQKEKIFAVVPTFIQTSDCEEGSLSFRIITPSTTRSRDSCPILKLLMSATVRQLHLSIANAISCTSPPQETVETCECNCTLANELASGPSDPTHFLVIHGKSDVVKLPLEAATVGSLQQALFSKFGQDLETRKKITYNGATQDPDDSRNYTKTPVVSICSKQRHVPIHARVDLDGSDRRRPQVLDLHTSELPIHPACFESSIEALGLSAVAVDGIVDIFAVLRTSSAESLLLRGKSAIFRDLAHWEPSTAQSDRGMAMFLSTLRMPVYYAFDELTRFPPALRCLHILVSGQTPTLFDCAAMSQSLFEVLKTYVEMDAITQDPARLFEGSRLVFGYILQSAKSLHRVMDGSVPNGDEGGNELRYTSAFHTYDIRDHKTHEPVLHALQTSNGLVEAKLFHSLQDGGILAATHLQSFLVEVEIDPRLSRFALQSGGTCPEVIVLSLSGLEDSYGSRASTPHCALDLDRLSDLLHLADMCGRNGLAVHGPSQLASAVAPCLTFDRNAHLAVYTGEQPCGRPGHSSIIFRPQHGEETIDPSVMEQLIAPIIRTYEQDGSAVFDAFGGAEVRRLQDPDEIIMFCVDSSSSMLGATDFREVNQERIELGGQSLAQEELHNALSLEESKVRLVAYESFGDMIAIVATASVQRKDWMTRKVSALLISLLSSEINKKSEALDKERGSAFGPVWRARISSLESDLQALKSFRAGLKIHEEALTQFLRFRASCLIPEAVQRWTWSFGDPVPAVSGAAIIPMLPYDLTEVPDHLRCPISHNLMEDAVEVSDGQIYSRSAIQKWFAIRKTSPLHGAPLDDLSLTVRPDIRGEVVSWVSGTAASNTSDVVTVTFDSRVGSFTRTVSRTTSSRDLYRLAYRGLHAKFEAFHLSVLGMGTLSTSMDITVSSIGLNDSDHITVRIPEDSDTLRVGAGGSYNETPEMCLVKVFRSNREQLFGFCVPRDTTDSLATLIWKYWRHRLRTEHHTEPRMQEIRTNMTENEYLTQGHCTGQLDPENAATGSTSIRGSQASHKVLKVMIRESRGDAWKHRITRLDVLKQMFEALINRMLAYEEK